MRTIVIAAAFALAHLPMGALAQDGPSYEETVEFIQAKTRVQGQSNYSSSVSQIAETAHCQLVNTTSFFGKNGNDFGIGHITNERWFFDLSEFDPSRVEIDGSLLRLTAKENRSVNDYEHDILPDNSDFKACISGKTGLEGYGFEGYKEYEEACRLHQSDVQGYVFISIFDPETNAPKLQRAFQHLIRLCGGKEELF